MRTTAPLLLCLLGASCTLFERDNRRALNWLDAHVAPSSAGARAALLPVAVPVGLVALAGDAVVIHPALAVDDAWGDTVELLWTPADETSLRQVLFAPLAAVATPFVFVGDWLWRSTWPVDPREEERR